MGLFDFLKRAPKKAETVATGAATTGAGAAKSTAAAAGSTVAAGAAAVTGAAGTAAVTGAAGAAAVTGAAGAAATEESAIGGLLGEGGAKLSGLFDKLKVGGLDDAVKSWVGKGENKEVSAEQIKAALGSEEIAGVASKLGVSEDEAAGKIAKALPGVIDKLTPDGIVPDPGAPADKLTGLFK